MKSLFLFVLVVHVLCAATNDVTCKKKGKFSKTITIGSGDSYSFKTQAKKKYGGNVKCSVTYKRDSSCPKLKFSCSKFNIDNKKSKCSAKAGDRMMIQEQGSKKAKSYCKKNSPDVSTTSKFLKVSFISNKKKHSTGAECMVECESDITTPTTPGGSGGYSCLDGWQKFGLKCYQKFDKTLRWNEAESFCQTEGGHLASVHSDGENDFIFNISGFATWIGGNFNYTEDMWTWTDGSAFDFRPSGFPCPTCPPTGDTQGPCTTLWHFPGWNYATCSPGFWATKFVCQNEPDPVNGAWGEWGSWSSCNTLTGKRNRTRLCNDPKPLNGGASCPGSSSLEETCPVNGGWGSWGSWSSCNTLTGMKRKTRLCNDPKPLNGGAPCPGSSSLEETCPVNGGWGSWGSWSSCNTLTGKKRKTRLCNDPKPLNGGAYCPGSSTFEDSCPVSGAWSPWGSWSSCNDLTGKKRRSRLCNNPKPLNGGASCPGSSTDETSCPGLYYMLSSSGGIKTKYPSFLGLYRRTGDLANFPGNCNPNLPIYKHESADFFLYVNCYNDWVVRSAPDPNIGSVWSDNYGFPPTSGWKYWSDGVVESDTSMTAAIVSTFESLSDKLLCVGKNAKDIVTTMKTLWNDYNWFGLTQEERHGWAYSFKNAHVYLHRRTNLCGKNLFLFRIAGPGPWSSGGCNAAAAPAAKKLIDTAASLGGSSSDIRNYVLNNQASVSLDHAVILVQDTYNWRWISGVYSSCLAYNSKVLYVINPGSSRDGGLNATKSINSNGSGNSHLTPKLKRKELEQEREEVIVYDGPYSAGSFMTDGEDEKVRRQETKDVIVTNGLNNATSHGEVHTNVDDEEFTKK